jgi:uncharacterized protein
MSSDSDVVIGAGDFASVHRGLEKTIKELAGISRPAILVPGNNETDEALRDACSAAWPAATVLHGESTEIEGVEFFGLGAGVPTTPWGWSFDLTDEQAEALLDPCPENAVLISHSPPRGHCDRSGSGRSLGSEAVLRAIEAKRPKLVLCGHIHESWGCESAVGPTHVMNLGPDGHLVEV